MTNLMPTPDDARRAVRKASWPNRDAENAAIASADEAVFTRVRQHESWLAGQANALADTVKDKLSTAAKLLGDVLELDDAVLHDRVAVTPATVAAAKDLRQLIEGNLADLAYARNQIARVATQAEDPYSAVQFVLRNFSVLRIGRSCIH